jgi:hypothetical protein
MVLTLGDLDLLKQLTRIMQRLSFVPLAARFSDDATASFRSRRRAFSSPAAWPEFEAEGFVG